VRWLLVLVAACDGKGDDSAGPTGEADTDTDTDTDVDGWTSIEGTLTYELRGYGDDLPEDGRAVCDATIEFTGTPYAGPCPECDFLFEVTGTVVLDDGNGACPFLGPLSAYDNTWLYDDPFLIGFASEMSYDGRTYVDAFVAGAYSTYYDGIVVQPISSDYGTATLTGKSFAWTFSQTKGDPNWDFPLYSYYYAQCRYPVFSDALGPYAPGNTTYETLPCEEARADVFSFRGAEGGTAYITVDTSDEAPLNLGFIVYSPEQCVDGIGFGNFVCSNGERGCASLALDTVAGDYLLVVQQYDICHLGGDFDYRLDIDAAWDPKVSQLRDDVYNGRLRPATLEITGTATLK